MHPTVPNQSHDSIGDDYAGHGEELGCASRPDGPPGRARSRKCGPLGAATIGPDHAHVSRNMPSARRDMRANGRISRAGQLRLLFATVGDEIDGIPISVVSVLARLGLDPREEAGRLSSLGNREAVEQLARLIAEVPGSFRPVGATSANSSALSGASAAKAVPILDCLPCPHGSGAREARLLADDLVGLLPKHRPSRTRSALWFTAGFRSVSGARKWEAKKPPPFGEAQIYRR